MSWLGKVKKSDEYDPSGSLCGPFTRVLRKYPPKIRKEVEKAATRRELTS